MESSVVSFLASLSSTVFWFSAISFFCLNAAALGVFVLTRNRRLVNQWTGKLVVADAVLLGAGVGVPLLAGLAKIGIHALASLFSGGPAPVR